MKSKLTKAILVSILVSIVIIALLSVAILFWLIPSGIVTREGLYNILVAAIPVIVACIILTIALLWIESASYSLKKAVATRDTDSIAPSTYDASLHGEIDEESDSSYGDSPIPEDWEKTEEFDPLDEEQKNRLLANVKESPEKEEEATLADAYPDLFKEDDEKNVFGFVPPEENKDLPPFEAYEFDVPEKKELSAATKSINFEWHKDTAIRGDGEYYIAPTLEQINRGEFVKKLRPTNASNEEAIITGEYNLAPEDTKEVESNAVVYSYEKDSPANDAYLLLKYSEQVESPIDEAEETEESKAEETTYLGDLFKAPLTYAEDNKNASASYEFLSYPYGDRAFKDSRRLPPFTEFEFDTPKVKQPLTAAEGLVDFTWNKDTAFRGEGERYIEPSKEQIEKGEFIAKLSPIQAPVKEDTVSPAFDSLFFPENVKVNKTTEDDKEETKEAEEEKTSKYHANGTPLDGADHDNAYNSLMLTDATKNASEEAFDKLPKLENVVINDMPETTTSEEVKEETSSFKYRSNGAPIDGADHDIAYGALMFTNVTKNTAEEAYERLLHIEDVEVKETEEKTENESVKEESNEYLGTLFVRPSSLSDTDESASTSYHYLTHPYGSSAYADYSSRTLPPFTEFVFDTPKMKEQVTAAEGCIDFAWNKDTAFRGEGERYIEPSKEQIEKGEFVVKLSPTIAPPKVDTAGPAYDSLFFPNDVKVNKDETEESEETKEAEEENISKYHANGTPLDGADHDNAYAALMLTDATKNASEEAFDKLAKIENVVINDVPETTTSEEKLEEESSTFKYHANGVPIDGADHDNAYAALMLTDVTKNVTEEAYEKLPHIEDVVIHETKEVEETESEEEESTTYTGDLFVSPSTLSETDESASTSYHYLTHPYGSSAYADYSSRTLPPFTEFVFDTPKMKEQVTAAEGRIDFTWNKDTAFRGEGERYIEPSKEQIEKGEFVVKLSPTIAPPKVDTASPAYDALFLPRDVKESEDEENVSPISIEEDKTSNNFKYVPDTEVSPNADHNDAYYALMGMAGKTKPQEPLSFSEEFTSILQLEMESALKLGYELTIARITTAAVDAIMALDFEALAFKESDDRVCIIFQCQTKAEATELVSMIKDAIGDKTLKVKMAELKGRNITPEAFGKEIMK